MINPIKTTLISLSTLFLWSCEETPVNLIQEVQLKVEVNHVFGSSSIPFELEKDYYLTSMGDSIKPTTLIYHINNFELSNDNGDKLLFDNSYALVDLSDKNSFEVINQSLPSDKTFNKISFTIGVEDSLVNKNGVLNTLFTSPMYWGMTNGYIHFKLEGMIKGGNTNAAVLHVGGYVEPYKLAKRITVNLANPISSAEKKTIEIEMDMAQYFKGIDLQIINSIHQPNDDARKISDNWPLMFKAK
jgi:hypothetical protein